MVRENTLVIEEALTKGIQRSDDDSRNLDYLNNVVGLTSTKNGLEQVRDVSQANFMRSSAQLLDSTGNMNSFVVSPTSWTLGTGWAWDNVYQRIVHTGGTGNTGTAQENYATLTDEQLYLVRITVDGFPEGNYIRSTNDAYGLQAQWYLRVSLGSSVSPKIIRDGDYYFLIPAETAGGSRLKITAFEYATVNVNLVELYTVMQADTVWPCPMVKETNIADLYLAYSAAYELYKDASGLWTRRVYPLYDAYNPDTTTGVLGSAARYQVADFRNAMFITRNVTFMAYLPSERQRFVISKTTAPGAVLNYNNRLILGGLIGDPYQDLPPVIDQYFDISTGWTLGAGWAISGGTLNYSSGSNAATFAKPVSIVNGSVLRIEFDITDITGSAFVAGFINTTIDYDEHPTITDRGHYVYYLTDDGTSANITFLCANSTGTFKIDNLKVTPVGYFGTRRWLDLFNMWKEYAPQDVMTSENQYFDRHWIMWSNLGGGDVYWPFTEEMALLGMPDTTRFDLLKPHFEDSIKAQQIGFLAMPFKGRVIGLHKVGEFILVFGTDGIALLAQVDKAEGFGFKSRRLVNTGINCNLSYTGTDDFCVFVDTSGVMWRFTANGALENIGYKHIFAQETGILWNLFYDQTLDYVHCNPSVQGIQNYVLTPNGMSTFPYKFTSLLRRAGELLTTPMYVNWYSDDAVPPTVNVLHSTWSFTTNEIDFQVRAIKTIHSIQIDSSYMEDMLVEIDYRYDTSSDWETTDPVPVNSTGVAVIIVSGVDFRIKVTGFSSTGGNSVIRRLDVKWHLSDKRNVRGLINA